MSKRSYRQNCALARTSDLIGERWTLLLLRDLLIFPRRFNELLESAKGMGSNLLARRLRQLEAAGLVERESGDGRTRRYTVTGRGRALEPALLALIRWGLTYGPPNEAGAHHRDDWDLLALKALFQPARAAGLAVTVQFAADEFLGWVRIDDGEMTLGLGESDEPDLLIGGTVADLFLGSTDPSSLLGMGVASLLTQFMSAFALRA